jgi:tetratricopeptide (TPR) repeat protein
MAASALLCSTLQGQIPRLAPPPPCRIPGTASSPALSLDAGMLGRPSATSVAILPFEVDIAEAERLHVPWALQQLVTADLARNGRLRLPSQESVARAVAQSSGLRDSTIRLLKAQYTLAGRVSQEKGRQDVDVALFHTGQTAPVWRATFGTSWTLQAMVNAITGGIEKAVLGNVEQSRPPLRPANAGAYDAVAAGDFALESTTLGGADSARAAYERALRVAPSSAVAASRMALALVAILERGGSVPGTSNQALMNRVDALIRQSLAADSTWAQAGTVRGMLARLRDPVHFNGAATAHARSVVLARDDAQAEYEYGVTLMRLGDDRGAEEHFRRALTLEPNHAAALAELSELAVRQNHWAEACAYSNASIEAWPFDPVPYAARARARLHLSQARDAYSDAETAGRLTGAAWVAALHVLVEVAADGVDRARPPARALVARWLAPGQLLTPRDASYLAMALVSVNEPRYAVEAMRRVRPLGADLVTEMRDPALAPLRSDTTVVRLLGEARGRGGRGENLPPK